MQRCYHITMDEPNYCKSDLLLHHEENVESNPVALQISMSQLSLDENELTETSLKAGVAELKVGKLILQQKMNCFTIRLGRLQNLHQRCCVKGKS